MQLSEVHCQLDTVKSYIIINSIYHSRHSISSEWRVYKSHFRLNIEPKIPTLLSKCYCFFLSKKFKFDQERERAKENEVEWARKRSLNVIFEK